jgi:formylglycine-generating enzyme required for sulfatase activity
MKCSECKTELPEGSRFCPYCGTPLTGIKHGIPANSSSQPGVQQTTKSGFKRPSGNPVLTFQNKSTGVSFKMIRVDGGTFYFGVTPKEAQIMMSEGVDWRKKYPLVTLKTYYIGETAVTQALWKAIMNQSPVTQAYWQSSLGDTNNPSKFKGDDLPVENVSWNNCQEFVKKLNETLGYRFRLPTEAEWEFASKGGNLSKGYEFSGSNDLDAVAWTLSQTRPKETTHPVKTKLPNELGLYDMTGNVWEWCEDEFDEESIRTYGDHRGNETNPEHYSNGHKILRGFSAFYFYDNIIKEYPSYRNYQMPNKRNPSLYDNGATSGDSYDAFGFRLALSLE